MNNANAVEQQASLQTQIADALESIAALEQKRSAVDGELQALSDQRLQHRLLEQACSALTRLEAMGAAKLFWGEHGSTAASCVEHAGRAIVSFGEKIAAVERRRKLIQDRIDEQLGIAAELTDEFDEQQREQEDLDNEFIVHREIDELPYRPVVMPWHRRADEDRRYRKALLAALLIVFTLGTATWMWVFPERPAQEAVEIPRQVVMLAQQQPVRLPPPPKVSPQEEKRPDKAEEKKAETAPEKKSGTPSPAPAEQAGSKPASAGLLAFKNSFSDLMDLPAQPKLGIDARVTTKGEKALGQQAERALLTVQAHGGGSGINAYGVSRSGSGLGDQVGGVQFARVESGIGSGGDGGDRPLSRGAGPSRTDEEIQIVFDRYKASLYRIYNRELRSDPTLSGKMVLRITIEPGGEVSFCKVESTDLRSKTLVDEIIERVAKFNFGPKDGVPRTTILYPIDFLPSSENGGTGIS